MKATLIERVGSWEAVRNAARTTAGLVPKEDEPTDYWKWQMLKAEHSPIRQIAWRVLLQDVPYWVSVHLTRHKVGIEHFVRSQRTDRTGVERDKLPQDALVDHEVLVNAQAFINISRKRLCMNASRETHDAWMEVCKAIGEVDSVMLTASVPECVYRGFCPEPKSCGFSKCQGFHDQVRLYRCYNSLLQY